MIIVTRGTICSLSLKFSSKKKKKEVYIYIYFPSHNLYINFLLIVVKQGNT